MKVLTIAAHPDDEVLGCGGLMRELADQGEEVSIAILGEGITSRYDGQERASAGLLEALHERAHRAAERLGAGRLVMKRLPDNRLDAMPLLEVVKVIEELVRDLDPEVIYTHHGGDLNVDHGIVHRAVLTATRPAPGQRVREIYAFEVPSSTEWGFQSLEPAFRPNTFVDISRTLEVKIDALRCYESEIRPFPHPRSPEAIEAIARRWGSVAGLGAAEAFELIRAIRPGKGKP